MEDKIVYANLFKKEEFNKDILPFAKESFEFTKENIDLLNENYSFNEGSYGKYYWLEYNYVDRIQSICLNELFKEKASSRLEMNLFSRTFFYDTLAKEENSSVKLEIFLIDDEKKGAFSDLKKYCRDNFPYIEFELKYSSMKAHGTRYGQKTYTTEIKAINKKKDTQCFISDLHSIKSLHNILRQKKSMLGFTLDKGIFGDFI